MLSMLLFPPDVEHWKEGREWGGRHWWWCWYVAVCQYSVLSSVWAVPQQASSIYNARMGLIFLLLMWRTIMLSRAVSQCPSGGPCVPPVHCAPHYLSSLYDPSSSCLLTVDTRGVCCPLYQPACRSSVIEYFLIEIIFCGLLSTKWETWFTLFKSW